LLLIEAANKVFDKMRDWPVKLTAISAFLKRKR